MKNAINPILGHSPKQEKVDSVTWVVMMVILMLDLTRKWLTAQQQNFSTWNHMTKRTPLIWFSSKPEKNILRLSRSKQDALMSSCTASSGGKEANCLLKPTLFTIKRDKNRRKHAKLAFYKNCSDLHENRAPGGFWEPPYDPLWPASSKPLPASISSLSRSLTWNISHLRPHKAAPVFSFWPGMSPPLWEMTAFLFEMGFLMTQIFSCLSLKVPLKFVFFIL